MPLQMVFTALPQTLPTPCIHSLKIQQRPWHRDLKNGYNGGDKLKLGYLSLSILESFIYAQQNASITDQFSFNALLLENNLTAPG